MANTRVLVNRRKAVRNIRKITRTMELIATARFKKAMDRASQAEAYTRKIAELAADLSATAGDVTHPLLQKRDAVKNSVLLVLCSNRGLCGGYNAGILREATAAIRRNAQENATLHLDLSGKRAITFFRYQGVKPEHAWTHFEDKPRFEEVEPLADRYIREFVSGAVDRVQVAYMKFFSASVQKPAVETLLPLERSAEQRPAARQGEGGAPKAVEYEFLPAAESILAELLPMSFKVRLFKCFLDAAVSEQIARRVTMTQATENADDMIKSLTRHYNRARQAGITKELLEVISGAEALK
jgi:F-type H+-transporting ATPase subunit gamma